MCAGMHEPMYVCIHACMYVIMNICMDVCIDALVIVCLYTDWYDAHPLRRVFVKIEDASSVSRSVSQDGVAGSNPSA